MCLGAAACGSPTAASARRSPSLKGSRKRPPGVRGEEHFPFPTHPGRRMGTAALPEGRSPTGCPTTPGETLSTFPWEPFPPHPSLSASTSAAAACGQRPLARETAGRRGGSPPASQSTGIQGSLVSAEDKACLWRQKYGEDGHRYGPGAQMER